jgi:hypothetical protein
MLSPEESLRLITQTIEDTKDKFKEAGHIFIFWGILIFIVTITQFVFIRVGLKNYAGWPCFLYPLGGFYMYAHFRKVDKKKNAPKTVIGNLISVIGAVLSANCMIIGFFFFDRMGENLFPIFLIFLTFWIILIGASIKFKPLIICGICVNLIAFATFFLNWQYQPLGMSLAAVIGFIIPGILFNKERRQKHV